MRRTPMTPRINAVATSCSQRRLTQRLEPTDHYISSFSWNKVRYRADRPLGELIDTLQKVCIANLVLYRWCSGLLGFAFTLPYL